jgi:hypothetical protein
MVMQVSLMTVTLVQKCCAKSENGPSHRFAATQRRVAYSDVIHRHFGYNAGGLTPQPERKRRVVEPAPRDLDGMT